MVPGNRLATSGPFTAGALSALALRLQTRDTDAPPGFPSCGITRHPTKTAQMIDGTSKVTTLMTPADPFAMKAPETSDGRTPMASATPSRRRVCPAWSQAGRNFATASIAAQQSTPDISAGTSPAR